MKNFLLFIRSRKKDILLITIDIFLFLTLLDLNFDNFLNLFNKILFILVFILINYICGKYRFFYLINFQILKEYINKLLVIFMIFNFFTFLYFYFINNPIFQNINFQLLIINYLFLYVICFIVQLTINIFLIKRRKTSKWIYIGRTKIFNKIKKDIKDNNLHNIKIDFYDKSKFNFKDYSFKGIILDNFDYIEKNNLKIIDLLNNRSLNKISQYDWLQKYLYKIPPDLIDYESSFEEDFVSKNFLGFQSKVKRLGDIFFSLLLLTLTFPIVLISIVLIKLEDQGPVFYKQKRKGINQSIFEIIKLRTMKVNAEQDGAKWFVSGDKRVTKIGKFLRNFRIDELTQLIQVLIGEMSLIGPRPERPEFDDMLSKEIPYYNLRYKIKPGISGWAQVNYPYGSSIKDSSEKLSYDLYYLKNYNIFIDFLILFKTMRLIFNGNGALPKNSK